MNASLIYEPAEDSFLLAEQVQKYAQGKVLDLGSGSGILAEIAILNNADVLAADINQEAVAKLQQKGLHAIYSNLFSNIKGNFDLIIFNPPYLPTEKNEQPDFITTAGPKGNEIIEKFLKQAKKHLTKEGKILLLCSSFTKEIPKIFTKCGYRFTSLSEKKLFFEKLTVYLLR